MRLFSLLLFLAAYMLSAPPNKARLTQVRVPVWMEAKTATAETATAETDATASFSAKDFRATLDGAPARVLDVQCPQDDLIILVVLDLSSGDLTLADPAKETLASEIRKLPPKTYVGLLRAQDGLRVLTDPTADRDAVVPVIEQQTLSGKAGLLNTVETMARIADSMLKKSPVRVAVLYVSDGDVRNYREDFTNPVINSSDSHDLSRRFPETLVQEKIAQLEGALAAEQAPLFIVNLNQNRDRLNEAYQNGMKQLAEATAGAAFFSRSTTEIPGEIQKTFAAITSHYSLTLALPDRVSARPLVRLTLPETDRTLSYRPRLVLRER